MKEGFRKIYYTMETGYIIGALPIGCRLCLAGAEIVLFITGRCTDNCWYCPISPLKYGRDVIYVDEERALSIGDIVEEVYKVKALGASITGGDPLVVPDRVYNVISILKKEFGEKFHIHLYTSGKLLDKGVLELLESSGLDELRFHTYSMELVDRVEQALDYGFNVGIEVPFIPTNKWIEFLKKLVMWADKMGVEFINLNEFEVSEKNIEQVLLHGLTPKGLGVEGALEKAVEFLRWCSSSTKNINIHFCTIEFKDNIQYRRRMVRKAANTMGLHEIPTWDGTLVSIEYLSGNVPPEYIVNLDDKRYIIPEYAGRLKGLQIKAVIREYYPSRKTQPLTTRIVTY